MFMALADPVRLRLFSLVANADEVCSCDLLDTLGKSQPTISHHTKTLARRAQQDRRPSEGTRAPAHVLFHRSHPALPPLHRCAQPGS
jgi:hypothetical protein